DAARGAADQTEHELRELIVEIRRLGGRSEDRRRVAVEVEVAARVVDLGLPVIEVEVVARIAAAELVTADQLREVRADREGAFVAEERRPARVVAQHAEPGVEGRESGVAVVTGELADGVRARDAE